MVIKVITKKDCPKCPLAKELGNKLKATVEFFDTETAEGLAEAAFHNVMSLPAVIVENDEGNVTAKWSGNVPKKEEVLRELSRV
jgi:ribonucleoside-triphosphate reductase